MRSGSPSGDRASPFFSHVPAPEPSSVNMLTPPVILGIVLVAVLAGLVMLMLVANYGQLWFQA